MKYFIFSLLFLFNTSTIPPQTNDVSGKLIFGNYTGIFASETPITFYYEVKNSSSQYLSLSIGGSFANANKKVLKYFSKKITLAPQKSQKIPFTVSASQAGFYRIYMNVKQNNEKLTENSLQVGYAIQKIQSNSNKASDFNSFWQKTKAQLTNIAPRFKIVPKTHLDTKYYKMYVVEMQSLNNITIRAWYRRPRTTGKVPVVVQLPSLGGSFFNPKSLGMNPKGGVPLDFAVLGLNIRGHGNSKDVVNTTDYTYDYITKNLNNKDKYMYRGAIADCIRAIDFLASRSEINQKQIIVEGASQGGALSLIVAGLDKRVALCCPDAPFLSDVKNLYKQASWFRDAVKKYMKSYNLTEWKALQNLSYFDTQYFATNITIPVLMSVGVQDQVCPPTTCFASFNKIVSRRKYYYTYPYGKHSGGGAIHRKRKFEWIRKFLR